MVKKIMAVIVVALFTVPVLAHAVSTVKTIRSDQRLVDVRIIGDDRGELAQYRMHLPGQQNPGEYYCLEAYNSERYSVQVTNRGPRRVGVVIAVDGRNIVSGAKSDLSPSERMYIIGAYETSTFEGWRTGMDRINRFYFTEQRDSYAERAFADGSAMGTIAFAVFEENAPPPPPPQIFFNGGARKDEALRAPETKKSSAEDAARPAGKASAKAENLPQAGTGYGEETHSPVRIVQFKPENVMSQKVVFKYEWHQELCKRGVLPCREKNRMWSQENEGFAPPPKDLIR